MLDFGREDCNHLATAERREWLVTNGIGSYASGTVAGLLTRRYHGLLIAALAPPLGRTLLLTKLDETATYDGRTYPLFANRWSSGVVEPTGFHHLERFHLEGTTPVWTFACADALLEKRVWMQPGANITYVRYNLRRSIAPLSLNIKTMVNWRNHHGRTLRHRNSVVRDNTHTDEWRMQLESVAHGLQVQAFDTAAPLFLLSDRAEAIPQHVWYRNYFLSAEHYRGLDPLDDNLYACRFEATIQSGESLTIVASTEAAPDLNGDAAYEKRQAYEQKLIDQSSHANIANNGPTSADITIPMARRGSGAAPAWIQHLILAADQFIVHRPTPDEPQGRTVIAGYPWFGDWGRDTMISLPGLTLVTGRDDIAARILYTFAQFVDQGMLPNHFPDEDETPEYNTVDATLWYFEAIRSYRVATGDDALTRCLFPVLQDIIEWHRRGTRYNIHVDPTDGLLYAGEPGVQLTWMDAKVDDADGSSPWVVTPRIGKPVEVNALWYNALRTMADFARRLGRPTERYNELAEQARAGFVRFWNEAAGYCYDVLDGPEGDDPALRPNQLLAVSLPHSPLTAQQQRAVVDTCARQLLTSYGLRSLALDDVAYIGRYGGDQRQRDGAYHQGTVWGWLIGPFIGAHLRVYGNRELARSFLQPLVRHLTQHGVGSISEIFDGDPPFTPRGCIAQAWSVAEMLRAWQATRD